MLKGKALPEGFREKVDKIVDNMDVCLTIGDADELGRELRVKVFDGNASEESPVLVYHSKLDSNVRESVLLRWDAELRRRATVMVAKERFCAGTYAPDVRTVVFAGGPRSLVEFCQGAWRG